MENPLLSFLHEHNAEDLFVLLERQGFDCIEDIEALTEEDIMQVPEPEEREALSKTLQLIRRSHEVLSDNPFIMWLKEIGIPWEGFVQHDLLRKEDLLNFNDHSNFSQFGVTLPGHQRKLFRRLRDNTGTAATAFWQAHSGLTHEQELLTQQGFDEIEDLMSMKATDLATLGITKAGTRMKLVRLLQSSTLTPSPSVTPAFVTTDGKQEKKSPPSPQVLSKGIPPIEKEAPSEPEFAATFKPPNPLSKYLLWEDASPSHGVKGLYQLMGIHNDEQNMSLVEKVITSKNDIFRLCNELIPNSANPTTNVIQYSHLSGITHRPLGLIGTQEQILSFLLGLNLLPPSHSLNELQPGIYALVANAHTSADKRTFVFYWPQPNAFAEISAKSLSCNLVAYVLKLCHDVYFLLDNAQARALPTGNMNSQSKIQRASIFEVKNKVGCSVKHKVRARVGTNNVNRRYSPSKLPAEIEELCSSYRFEFALSPTQLRTFLVHAHPESSSLRQKLEEIERECNSSREEEKGVARKEIEDEHQRLKEQAVAAHHQVLQQKYPFEYNLAAFPPMASAEALAQRGNQINFSNFLPDLTLRKKYCYARALTHHFEVEPAEKEEELAGMSLTALKAKYTVGSISLSRLISTLPTASQLTEVAEGFIREGFIPESHTATEKIRSEFMAGLREAGQRLERHINNQFSVQQQIRSRENEITQRFENRKAEKIQALLEAAREEWYSRTSTHKLKLTITGCHLTSSWGESQIDFSMIQEYQMPKLHRFAFFQLDLMKNDDERVGELGHVLTPKCSGLGSFSMPREDNIVGMFQLRDKRCLIVSHQQQRTQVTIYNLAPSNATSIFQRTFGRSPAKLVDFDEDARLLAFYVEPSNMETTTDKSPVLEVYRFDEKFHRMEQACKALDLGVLSGPAELVKVKFVRSQKCVLLLDVSNRIRIFDTNDGSLQKKNIQLPETTNVKDMLVTPNGLCLAIVTEAEGTLVVEPYLLNGLKALPSVLIPGVPPDWGDRLTITRFGSQGKSQLHLVAVDPKTGRFSSHCLSITTQEQSWEIESSTKSREKHHELTTCAALEYLFFVYDKFAVRGLLDDEEDISMRLSVALAVSAGEFAQQDLERRVKNYVRKVQFKLDKTDKPSDGLELEKNLRVFHAENLLTELREAAGTGVGDWIRRLACFVPIQIARAEGNAFHVLSDGLLAPLEEIGNVTDFAKTIRLGMYDSVLSSWEGPVKILSSMGKQSTGKSYTLNHLTGSLFDISGARCTDGCWLTVRICSGVLYVVLDFEGLGSFERTDQEDMLLSIFNAAISNLTIFKTEYRLDRDMEQMFSRFQSGVNLIKQNQKLFAGIFCIVIKDVPERDIDSLTEEFSQKLQNIISINSTENFISKMYNGRFMVLPFPPLGNASYYEELKELQSRLDQQPGQYHSGRDFQENLSLLLAKVCMRDWTPLDGQQVAMRLRFLYDHIPNVLAFGKLNQEGYEEDNVLKSLDDSSLVDNPQMQWMDEEEILLPENERDITVIIPVLDSDIVLLTPDPTKKDNNNNNEALVASVIRLFEANVCKRTGANFPAWQQALQRFINCIITRRMERVRQWISLNLAKFKEDNEIVRLKDWAKMNLETLKQTWQLCLSACDSCFMGCLALKGHEERGHSCLGGHMCDQSCAFCEGQVSCGDKMGHTGKHTCKIIPHLCGRPCLLERSSNCNVACAKPLNHELDGDAEHRCNSKVHFCGEACSAVGCGGKCNINADKAHTVHKCQETQCLAGCMVSGCRYRCSAKDHFHHSPNSSRYLEENEMSTELADPDISKMKAGEHYCGNDHPCPQLCESDGICHVSIEMVKQKTKQFAGKRSTFDYECVSEANGEKKGCCKRIPAFTLHHDGPHEHSLAENVMHWCDMRCPSCLYYCEKPYGHSGHHKTSHGNMRNCYFISDQEAIDIGDRKYVVGESGMAEMCNMFCKTLGRGHIHILQCEAESPSQCTYAKTDGRRHETLKYGPDESIPKDELTHAAYWSSIHFEDPCSAEEQKLFALCPYVCSSDDHKHAEKEEDKVSYCQEALWHDPVPKAAAHVNTANSTISIEGHVFQCKHSSASGRFHVVLALDDSGSMRGTPWKYLEDAVQSFMQRRLKDSQDDIVSIIIHNSRARIACEAQPITSNPQKAMSFNSGGNDFADAFKKCYEVISRTDFTRFTPLLIFMSDGGCGNGEKEIKAIGSSFNARGLVTYTIGFGSADEKKLKGLADLVGGTYCRSEDGIKLVNTFTEISAKLGAVISLSSMPH